MKRRGEAATLIIAILAALGIGAATYYYLQSGKKTSGDMQTSEDKRLEQEAKRKFEALAHEIENELSGKFGEFYPQALESLDLVQRKEAKWGDRTVFEARDSRAAFMLNEEFVQKFISLEKSGSLEIVQDGSRFRIDVNDGKSFDLEETLRGLLHQVSRLKAGASSRHIDNNYLMRIADHIKEKSVDAYGYVRLIFKTNIDDVYVVAVFSIDPNEVKHSKGRYIATGRDLLISRTSDEIVDGVKDQMRFNRDFYILEFNLNADNALSSNSTAKECLEGFISQEVFKQFRK